MSHVLKTPNASSASFPSLLLPFPLEDIIAFGWRLLFLIILIALYLWLRTVVRSYWL